MKMCCGMDVCMTNAQSANIERIQKRAFRIILPAWSGISSSNHLKMQTLSERRENHCIYIDLIVNLQYLRLSTVYTTYSQTALEIQGKVKLDPMRICIIILNLEHAERFKSTRYKLL
jgi:hypothetical protein